MNFTHQNPNPVQESSGHGASQEQNVVVPLRGSEDVSGGAVGGVKTRFILEIS